MCGSDILGSKLQQMPVLQLRFALVQVSTSNKKPHRFQAGENGIGEAVESIVVPFFKRGSYKCMHFPSGVSLLLVVALQ